jgi:uncharacterized membrane protein
VADERADHGERHGANLSATTLNGLAPVLDRNIAALQQRRAAEEQSASRQERVADEVTKFTASMYFVLSIFLPLDSG